jgi:hypothetical protein
MNGLEVNLKEFNLGDILQFLARVKKTGVLKIESDTPGEIYLKDGFVIHAADANEKGLEVLINFSFGDLVKGVFEPGVAAPEQTINEDIGKLTEDVDKRRIEFQEIKRNLPPLETILAKSTKELETSVAIRRTDWQILALVDGKRNLSEVIAQSKLGGYEATKTLVWLKEKGLIYDPREAERVMSGLIRYLEILFQVYTANGWIWLQKWAELAPENKRIPAALNVDEKTFKIELRDQLNAEEIKGFFTSFDEFVNNEGPNAYGKLLFKKKREEFTQKMEPKT